MYFNKKILTFHRKFSYKHLSFISFLFYIYIYNALSVDVSVYWCLPQLTVNWPELSFVMIYYIPPEHDFPFFVLSPDEPSGDDKLPSVLSLDMSLIRFYFVWLMDRMELCLEIRQATISPGFNIITSSNSIRPSSWYKARGAFSKAELKSPKGSNYTPLLSWHL